MVLVLSDDNDYSTNVVLDWLAYKKIPFKRVNSNDEIILISIDFNNLYFEIKINSELICSSDISGFWYRRGFLNFKTLPLPNDFYFYKKIKYNLLEDKDCYSEFIYYILTNTKLSIGDFTTSVVNKLKVLKMASDFGMLTPATSIVSSKEEIIKFKNIYKKIVTKTIKGNPIFVDNNYTGIGYTFELTDIMLNKVSEIFSPSLVQEKIEKSYEIRSFYLKGVFYSMAIFSQNDPQTIVDFRVYNFKKPNRNVPYNLPKKICDKLKKIMDYLHLDTGSIDLIVNTKNEFYFLEVNPVGQFGMTSNPCNYFLEEKIADYFYGDQRR